MTTPQVVYCVERRCRHFLAAAGPIDDPTFVCRAFPCGIPAAILSGQDQHLAPVAGQEGEWTFEGASND